LGGFMWIGISSFGKGITFRPFRDHKGLFPQLSLVPAPI
jgi:hypothetical protein